MYKRKTYNRKRKRQNKIMLIGTLSLLLFLSIGYAAFQTNLSITAKGNIKDLQKEVDAQVPTNELLFWGQANNPENTLTTLKDKSGNNNDGTLNGFENTNLSGYNDDELVFDGINDYVEINLANYDFQNSISYIAYVKINKVTSDEIDILVNWELSGSGLAVVNEKFLLAVFDAEYRRAIYNDYIDTTKYYTLIGTYDGANAKLYVDGQLVATTPATKMTISPMPVYIGANPSLNVNGIVDYANMSLKEAMLYDRALSENEVKQITEGFQRKYK